MNRTKNSLCLLAAAFCVQGAYADESKTRYAWVDGLAQESFFKDSTLDFSTRNYWKYLKEDESLPKKVHNAWAQSLTLDYRSGYFADFIGFDLSYTGVIKLGASDYFSSRALLYNNGSGYKSSNADGFNRFGQRYVKFKLAGDDLTLNAKGGWQILKNYGVLSASSRSATNSYLGWSGTLGYGDLSLDMAYVTSSINRDSPDKVHFQTKDYRTIDYIYTGGLNYRTNDLKIAYFYGYAQDYVTRHGLETSYKVIDKLTLGSQIYATYGEDYYKDMAFSRREFDDKAWFYEVDAHWKEKAWSLKLGLAYTKAEKENGVGYYYRHMARDSRGRFNGMTVAGLDYMRDGEKALALMYDRKISDDFTTGVFLNYGQFNYKGVTFRNGEVNIFGRWTPMDARLKNLTVFAMVGPGWSYRHSNQTPVLVNGNRVRAHTLGAEIIVDYKFGIF